MSKRLVGLVALVLVFGAIFGGKYYQSRKAAAAQQSYSAAAVATAVAQEASWANKVRAVGTLRAVRGTQISAQIAGNVTHVLFESGARVKKGDPLVQLDDSTQLAMLRSDQARLEAARADLQRAQNLIRSHAVSEEQLQAAQRDHDVAEAAVASDEAILAKLHITAPFSGVLGIREVSLGQYVAPGTGIVEIQQWDPLLLDFSLPQEWLGQVAVGQTVDFETSARPGEVFAGKITATAARVDPETRNITVQATIANGGGQLRPGLFGHVTLTLGGALKGIAVPQTAMTYSTFGDSVFVVATDERGAQVAKAKLVQVLHQQNGEVLLKAGAVEGGAEVIVAGQIKLNDGAPVSIDNSVKP